MSTYNSYNNLFRNWDSKLYESTSHSYTSSFDHASSPSYDTKSLCLSDNNNASTFHPPTSASLHSTSEGLSSYDYSGDGHQVNNINILSSPKMSDEQKKKPSYRPYKASARQSNNNNSIIKKRPNFPKATIDYLENWLYTHLHDPFPTEKEKDQIAAATGVSASQLSHWFINARRRRIQKKVLEDGTRQWVRV